ncbi:SPOR domain-containing protein [Vibrio alginolyticus]|uniref:SPOR domain-containing protein n=1 Tax=Vibrio sp. B1FLJ16 TaxID=2751178 RepID=UPI0015F62FE3|nr:SPOR domain-containing protein [Vibrio sp. B1FLJ16]CAD7796954.1 hypothetical protein ACOMICROBIO_EPCKBFOG_00098 [Vibrio sp. B1FLJ16]CAD7797018.1 hypothetical protein ACOMICROBIO_FLGHMIGD_00108 [Vibrio sp. B1FLJ16]CAE6878963.1 hypothetical protein ACOMICROBIO_FLGHMIGD_00108 [Vibrio sp. B1FLJ16]CAE6879601.1 hypothetical protein ACOMICROBIO_EPCKBFOG_00098 [Vibrio sp. B1FLJ16]
MKLSKVTPLLLSIALAGCSIAPSPTQEAQCVGVMTSQDAYGHMNPNHFTVQVLALKQEADVQEYIRHIEPSYPVWVNWKSSRGTRWYAVTAGDFKTKDEAYRAIQKLPHNVRQSEPFILSFEQMKKQQETNVVRMR